MELIKKVLSEYHINPQKMEQKTNRLYKITTDRNIYALKRSRLSNESIDIWHHVYTLADKYQLNGILPVYVTKKMQISVSLNNEFYYLSPWIKDDEKVDYPLLFEELAKIHLQTKSKKKIDVKQFTDNIHKYGKQSEKIGKELKNLIETFEKSEFMSPIELQVCTHFHRLNEAIHIIRNICQQLVDEKENDLEEWDFCLCHGNIKGEHFLTNKEQYYFINWEKAAYNYPTFDLTAIFDAEAKKPTVLPDSLFEGYKRYMDTMKLNEKQFYFMLIHLLNPSRYLSVVKNAISKKPESMLYETINVEKEYRLLLFGIRFLSHVMENKE